MKRKNPSGEGQKKTTLLEEKEDYQFKCKSNKTCDKSTTDSKPPIVPILLGFVLGIIFGKFLLLFLKIIGIL